MVVYVQPFLISDHSFYLGIDLDSNQIPAWDGITGGFDFLPLRACLPYFIYFLFDKKTTFTF